MRNNIRILIEFMDLKPRDIDIFEKWKFITHFRLIRMFNSYPMTIGIDIKKTFQTR